MNPRPYEPVKKLKVAGFAFDFTARRYRLYYVWQVYVPLSFIVIMSWACFWIDPTHADAQIAVATGSMLTLIAYLKIKKSSRSLPVLLESLLGISIGTFLILLTDFTQSLFIVSFITWGIGIGMCKVIRAVFLYRNQRLFLVLGINGLLSIFLNLIIYIQAEVTKEPIVWVLSIYFAVYGLLMIIFGAKVKTSQD